MILLNKLRLNCFRNYQSYTDVFANINFHFFCGRNTICIYIYIHYELYTIFFLLIILCIIRMLRQILNVYYVFRQM